MSFSVRCLKAFPSEIKEHANLTSCLLVFFNLGVVNGRTG